MKHSKKGSRGPRLYFSHFQNRILCAFLLCTLIPIFIIGGISYAVSYNIAKDKILNASISADAQLHTQFDNRLQQVENIADTLQYNMYNLMQADAPMDTLAMFSEIRSNLSMFKTSFDLAYINIFLPDEHMASSESLYFFPVSKLSDFQIPKEVLENPGTSSVWFYQDLLSVPFLVNNSYHITNSVSCCRVLKHPGTDSIKYAYIIYLDASEFSSILQEIFQDNQITSYILTDNGKIVASNNPSLLSASLDEEKLDFLYNKGDSLKKRAHTNYHTTTLRNGWLQVTEIPDSYIMQNTHILIKSILLTILISLPLTILVVVLISKNLTRRIKTLSRAMETLQLDASDTNMKALVPQDRAPETFDEIDKLGITFEKMQHSLNDNLQSILELSLTEERLKYQLLQSQINPHFLYNILGSIQTCQSLGKLDIANQMLTNLTRFYRMTLRKSEDLISIRDELTIAQLYLEMEKLCHNDNLTWEINMEDGIEKNIDWSALDATVIAVEYNSLSALDILKDTHVDLIISDIEMPDLDGISMSQKALEIQPFIKVILVSAYDKFEYAKRAIRLCVYDYIEKPLDYHYLTEKIKNAFTDIDRTQKNTELVKASRPVMTEKFFHDLLHYPGEDPATHLSQYLKYLDLRSDYDFFDVLILETEPDPAKSELDFTQYQIQLLNILNLVKEEMEIFDNVFYLKEFSGIVCIIGQNSKHPQHFLQVIHQVASTIVESCKNNVLSLNIGIGSLADSIWKLPVSFASASHSLKYLFFFPHKNIFDAREALGKELNLLSFSENTDEELIRLICSKDMTAIEEWITCYFQNLLGQVQDKNLVFIRIYSLLGRILKFLYEMNLDTGDLEREIIQVYTRFDSFRTYEQFVKWLTQLCASVCEKMDSSLQNYHNQIYTMALGYIRENFETNTLCLNDIARHANISPAYLSSLFKKVSGQSISDTITALRIESACHYLESTSLSLKEISTKCGYTNQYYFSNSFKKKLGMSPSAYREARGTQGQ